jgi:hypothetical protein
LFLHIFTPVQNKAEDGKIHNWHLIKKDETYKVAKKIVCNRGIKTEVINYI